MSRFQKHTRSRKHDCNQCWCIFFVYFLQGSLKMAHPEVPCCRFNSICTPKCFPLFFHYIFYLKSKQNILQILPKQRQRCTLWKTANTKVFGLVFITFTHTDFKKMVSLKHLWMWHYLRSSPCSENFQNVWKLI